MNKYTAFQAEVAAAAIGEYPLEIDWKALKVVLDGKVIADMLREYAAHLARQSDECSIGVGTGDTGLFVRGTHEAIKRVQDFIFDAEKYRRQSDGPSEDIRAASDTLRDVLETYGHPVPETAAIAALTSVWHNRPAQESDAYRQGFIHGSKAVSAQEKAEPVAEQYQQCRWSPENPDDCPYCAGEACSKCGAGCWSNRKDCAHDSLQRHELPEVTAPPAERVMVPNWQHIANELADATCNGIQWIKNVRDGISSADDAINEMTENYHRIQALSAAPEADHHE